MSDVAPRIGVSRSGAPHPVVAEAEARVVHHELGRRLGPIVLDLRTSGPPIGRWAPIEHAAWPTDVDAVVQLADLTPPGASPLTALFARTVAPEAAEVRRRMLGHLGLLDAGPFDDTALARLDGLVPTPTDVWLLVTEAASVTVTDPAVAAFAAGGEAAVQLDEAFDRVAERLREHPGVAAAGERELARLRSALVASRAEIDELSGTLARERTQAAALIDDLAHRAAARSLAATDDPAHDS